MRSGLPSIHSKVESETHSGQVVHKTTWPVFLSTFKQDRILSFFYNVRVSSKRYIILSLFLLSGAVVFVFIYPKYFKNELSQDPVLEFPAVQTTQDIFLPNLPQDLRFLVPETTLGEPLILSIRSVKYKNGESGYQIYIDRETELQNTYIYYQNLFKTKEHKLLYGSREETIARQDAQVDDYQIQINFSSASPIKTTVAIQILKND